MENHNDLSAERMVTQVAPVGFMVFAHNDLDADYMIFPEWHEAQTYALEQEERANAPDDSWPIYALWASEWQNEKRDTGDSGERKPKR